MPNKLKSLWQSVSGEEARRQGPRQTVCNESAQEGVDCAKGQDHRAYQNRAPGVGLGASVALPGHVVLCLSDGCQTSFDPRVCERRRTVYAFVQAGAFQRGRGAHLHW